MYAGGEIAVCNDVRYVIVECSIGEMPQLGHVVMTPILGWTGIAMKASG